MLLTFISLLLTIASGAEIFRDTVSRTCAPHRANFVMDGLSEVYRIFIFNDLVNSSLAMESASCENVPRT